MSKTSALQVAAFLLLTIGFHTAHARDNLLTFRFQAGHVSSVGYFLTTGSTDVLVYAPGPVTGAAGNPNSSGWIAQATYLPWQNRGRFTTSSMARAAITTAAAAAPQITNPLSARTVRFLRTSDSLHLAQALH
jgi:hypothetical protein